MGLLSVGYVSYDFGFLLTFIFDSGSGARGDITDIGVVGY